MASLRPLRLSILLALTLLSVNLLNAQGPAVDCKTQNTNSSCATAQTPSASVGSLQPVSSTPAKVTYRDGQLTITARNASLGDVLRAVSTETGAVIEFPAERAGEHFFAQAGPGPVRDVLAKLFNGSGFNYVLLGSPSNPNLLQRMILTNASQPTASSPSQLSSRPPIPPPQTAAAAEPETSEVAVPAAPAVATAPTPPTPKAANPEHQEAAKGQLSLDDLKQMVKDNKLSMEAAKQMWHDQRAAERQQQQSQGPQESNPTQ